MADWFWDAESGSDNNSGDSYAVTLTGAALVATGTTTVTSAGGGFTGLSGRKIFIVGIGGRTISNVTNDTTIVLNASVTAGTYTFNIGGRRLTRSGFTTANCAGLAGPDRIKCKASAPPTSLSVSGNWADCSPTLVLLGTSTDVDQGETPWTAATNVTVTQSTTAKRGTYSISVAISDTHTTGKAAYFDLGSNQDYSSKQILTFWMQCTTTASAPLAGYLEIKFCSDAAGATPVSTFSVPALPIGGSLAGAMNVWVPVAIDLGSAISATCRSIAIYVTADTGGRTFLFDDFKVWSAPNLTKNVELCETAWTASANVTCTTSTTRKEGATSVSIAVAAGFTTGKAAYRTISSTDFSGYQQLSFWIQATSALITSGNVSIKLCSDTTGDTPVDAFAVPSMTGAATTQWMHALVDKGSALGSAIQSIAAYIDSDIGAQTFLIDDIIACKTASSDDAISHRSLLGKTNSTGSGGDDSETWYGIRSIAGNTVTLEAGCNSSAATASRGYFHTPEIGSVFKREAIATSLVSGGTTAVQTFNLAGTAGNLLSWSGGWDRTDMSTQTDETWFSGTMGLGYGFVVSADYQAFERFGLVRYGSAGINISTNYTVLTFSRMHLNCNQTNGLQYAAGMSLSGSWVCNNGGGGINCTQSASNSFAESITTTHANNNVSNNINILGAGLSVSSVEVANSGASGFITNTASNRTAISSSNIYRNSTAGFSMSGILHKFLSCVFSGNGNRAIIPSVEGSGADTEFNLCTFTKNEATFAAGVRCAPLYFNSCSLSDVSFHSFQAFLGDGVLKVSRYNNTDNDHRIYMENASCLSQTTVRHTASGIAWALAPTSANVSNVFPFIVPIGTYAVGAGSTVIKVWLRRTNTGLTLMLVCPAGRLPGMTSSVSASMTAAANTWEEVSITIAPTSSGVVELEVWAYGGTTYTGYIDDLTVNGVAIPLDYAWKGQPAADPVVAAGGSPVTTGYPLCG